MFKNFADLIERWSPKTPISEFARDIGVTTEHAAQMKSRDSIPAAHWNAVVSAAKMRGIGGVTHQELANLAARNRKHLSPTAPSRAQSADQVPHDNS